MEAHLGLLSRLLVQTALYPDRSRDTNPQLSPCTLARKVGLKAWSREVKNRGGPNDSRICATFANLPYFPRLVAFMECLTSEQHSYLSERDGFFCHQRGNPAWPLTPNNSLQFRQNKQLSNRGGAKNHGNPVPCPSVNSTFKKSQPITDRVSCPSTFAASLPSGHNLSRNTLHFFY